MQPTENPYAVPDQTHALTNRQIAFRRLLLPAIFLLVFAIATPIIVGVFLRINFALYSYKQGKTADKNLLLVRKYQELVFTNFLVNAVVIYAAIQMLYVRHRIACILGATIAMIPFLSPGYFLGIPFAGWALVVLLRKDTRVAFAEVK